jgi:signal transduction histidine kinase
VEPPEPSTATASPDRLLRHRRRSLVFGAALIATTYGADWLLGHAPAVYVWRAGWIAGVLAAAWLHQPGRARLAHAGALLAAAVTGAAVVGIVALTGGTTSLYAGMLLVIPFAALVALPDVPSAALVSGAWCIVGGAVMRLQEGQPGLTVIGWILLSILMVLLAVWGAVSSRHLWANELAAEQATIRVMAALGESERRRAETERLAEVGRLAAQVAHEVNSPLAVVKSNVGWLGEADLSGGDAAERPQVVAETLHNVERIGEIVSDLRRSAGVRPAPREKP